MMEATDLQFYRYSAHKPEYTYRSPRGTSQEEQTLEQSQEEYLGINQRSGPEGLLYRESKLTCGKLEHIETIGFSALKWICYVDCFLFVNFGGGSLRNY